MDEAIPRFHVFFFFYYYYSTDSDTYEIPLYRQMCGVDEIAKFKNIVPYS
jgi:hypothetical protein